MRKLLLIIVLLLPFGEAGSGFCQGNMITITSTVPSQITVCGTAKLFTVTIYNPSPFLITNDTLFLTMPTGIAYVPGSMTGGTFLNNFGGVVKVFLPDIPTLTNLNISFMANAQCTVIAYIAGGGITKNNMRVNYTANNNHTYTINNSALYLVKQPFLSITTVTNQSYTGNIGNVFTRCITVLNAGFGELSDFTFTDVHGSGIQITAVNIGVLTNIGATAKVVLNGTDFSSIGDGDYLFENGESVSICETVSILNCISASSDFKAFWSCSPNACQSTTSSANVLFPNYLPILALIPSSSMNSCIGAGNASPQQLSIVNTGLGNAINVQLQISQSTGGGSIDTSSFTIQTGIGGAPVSITPNSIVATSAVCITNPIEKVVFNLPVINAGDTVYLKWNTYSCCSDACANIGQNYINGWQYSGSYQSICENTYIIAETWGRGASQIYGDLANDGSPSTLTNGQTGTFNFLFSNYGNSYPVVPGAYWKFEFTLPPFPCLTYSNIQILKYDGLSTWTPSSTSISGNIVTAIFNGSAPWNLTQAELKINLSLNCAGCTPIDSLSALSVKSFYIPDNTCGCEIGVSCQSADISILCPDPCPAGIFFNYFEIKRTSYGLPDNEPGGGNGIPDGVGSLDFAKIKTNRAMFGDTVSSTFTGIVNTNFTHPTLQYCYASSSISNGNLLSFLDAQLLIYRGGVLLATCTNFTPVVTTTGTTRSFLYDLSAPTLIADGCLPGGYINTDGDSLIFKPRYKVTINPGGSMLTCYSTNKFYSSDIANPALASDKYQCSNFNGNFSVIGYQFNTNGSGDYYVRSCDNITISQNYYLRIGPGSGGNNIAGGNLFPYEYRNWAHIAILTTTIPPGYTFISARFNQFRTAGTLAVNTSPWEIITPANSNSDTLVFAVEPYFQGYGGTIPLSDDDFEGTLEVTIQPGCEVTPVVSQAIQYDWTYSPTPYLTGTGSDTTFISATGTIIYTAPVLFLQSVLPSVFALDSTTSWDISISNTSNVSNALNTWLSGPVISGVSITQVFDLDNSVIIPPTGSIYPVGTVNAAGVRNFRITASFISCAPDSIILYSGWDCNAGYPASVQTYPCTPEQITLTLTPLSPAFWVNSTGPPGSIQLCDTAEFTAEGIDVQLGTAYNVILNATLPAGVALLPGSSQFSYPDSSAFISIPDPAFISGTTWSWNISAIDSLIGSNGLKGILDTVLNTFKVRFKVITDCGYISGSSIVFVLTGKAACGLVTEPDIFTSPPLDITGASNPYTTAVKLSTTYVSPCAGNSILQVIVHNQGPAPFGSTDSVVVILPVGVPFVTGSFNAIYNAPPNGTPIQYIQNGNSYLVWRLPTGTAVGDSTVFTFEYIGDPPALSCGIIYFEAQTYSTSVVTCIATGNDCITNIVTGATSLAVFTYKAYLSLSNGLATSIPNPPGGETVTLSYDITNTGQAILTDADSIVQFYFDANGNGIYNAGDVFIAEDTLIIPKDSMVRYTSTFNAPAGQACSIIAIIDPAVNSCVCDFSQLLLLPSLITLDTDTTLCSGQTLTLGSPPVTGYIYSWAPATGLSGASIANPVLTASNLTSVPVSTTYILTTNRMGCLSNDTITITVNPGPVCNAGAGIAICTNNPGQIGDTATSGYAYLWFPTTGLSDTTISNPVVTLTYSDTITYVVTAISLGCISTDSIEVKVNPLPAATIEGTAAVCKNGMPPIITLRGAGGTAPYTLTYTINGITQPAIVTLSGDSITLSVPTSSAGSFIYRLISVQDASSTACSQAQSDSATVTVNPLPIATIAGTTAVCLEDSTNITFTGSAGTAPYIFTYTINGGANQTVSTTGGDTIVTILVPTGIDGTFIYALLSVMDSSSTTCSQAQSGSATVTVDPLPTATISGTDTVCQGAAMPDITFVGYGGVAPYTFTYTINGVMQAAIVTISGDSVTLAAPTTLAGIFIYALVSIQDANAAACTHPQTGNVTITVAPLPIANFGVEDVCLNQDVHFTDSTTVTSGTVDTWLWNFGNDSLPGTTQNPVYLYMSSGTYTVSLISTTNSGCKDTITKTTVVHPVPDVQFYTTPVSIGICDGTNVQFNDASAIAIPDSLQSWAWDFGDISMTDFNQNTAHLYAAANSYTIQLLVVSDFGCKDSITKPITINPKPVVNFTGSPVAGCEPLCISFSDSSFIATGNSTQWIWDVGDDNFTSNSQIFEHCYRSDSIYSPISFNISLTVTSDSGCVSTLSKNNYITAYPKPDADFTVEPKTETIINPVISVTDLSIGADFWNWDFGGSAPLTTGQDTASIQSPSPHIYADTGTYTITLITSTQYGCLDTAYQNITIEPDFVFYIPNAFSPNDDGINDSFSGKGIFIIKYEMSIFDRWGNLIFFSDDINKPWEGRANLGNEIAQRDVYVYTIKVTDIKMIEHKYIGRLTLVR